MQFVRKKARTQHLWNLQLAWDRHLSLETVPLPSSPHMMRVMLVSNLAVDQRFANGTQGRLMHWNPCATESARFALPASHPELLARFVKESSLDKPEMLPDIDHMDIGARQENLAVRGEPVLLQLCVAP